MAEFDTIAESWYSRRHYSIFQPELSELSNRWARGTLINIGCGHGADSALFRKFSLFGIDNSIEMLRNAKKYGKKFAISSFLAQGDASSLPFKRGSFDNAIAIAVYHHLKDGRREDAFS
ncbi:MAG: class I SAM-dependent methyltransferase, partial [Candidatus Aenigmarchaeota archaeon]|nr:class I SAM-dependent methyltransferase [Candidatus Aenigmarchaeota archaeon]